MALGIQDAVTTYEISNIVRWLGICMIKHIRAEYMAFVGVESSLLRRASSYESSRPVGSLESGVSPIDIRDCGAESYSYFALRKSMTNDDLEMEDSR